MAFKRPTGRALTATQLNTIQDQVTKQVVGGGVARTSDPSFPVLSATAVAGKQYLAYVPSHLLTIGEGDQAETFLRMDRPYFHRLRPDDRSYPKVRCIRGLVIEDAGLTGECPLCDGASLGFEYANTVIEAQTRARGLDPNDRDDETVRSIRGTTYRNRPIAPSEQSYTFPLVLIERESEEFTDANGNKKTRTKIKKDENGNPVFNVVWYTVTVRGYERTWGEAFASFDEDDQPTEEEKKNLVALAGHFFIMKFGDEGANARDAMGQLKVTAREDSKVKGIDKAFLDEATKDWTPEKAQEVIYDNNIYPVEDVEGIAAPLVEKMETQIELHKDGAGSPTGGASIESLAKENAGAIEAGARGGLVIDDDDVDDEDD